MANIVVPLTTIDIPWIIRSLEHTLEALQQEARRKGEDPELAGPIPIYKELIKTFATIHSAQIADSATGG
jgi:hypothetical protein